jgi:thiol-disulfide isomerase/thioredoxin
MKTSYTLALIGALILGTVGVYFFITSTAAATGISVGDKAVNMRFTTIDGSTFDLNTQKGKVVVVDFITTTCPVCVEEFKVLNQLADDPRITLVSVNLDKTGMSDLQLFALNYGIGWKLGTSQQAGVDYEVSGVPTVMVIDKEGVIRYRGYYTSQTQLEQIIDRYS